jgi:ATP-dependent helicase/nuclease subunit A
VSPEGPSRYVPQDSRLCAQRLLGCAPHELLDHLQEEENAEREEAVRLAYVAATRARDLLVVSAVGDMSFVKKPEFFEASWLFPLYPALYPSEDQWRVGRGITVLNAPPECAAEMFVAPGMHTGQRGGCDVFWFDPAKLDLAAKTDGGLENEAILTGTSEQKAAGVQEYRQWQTRRQGIIESGKQPLFRVVEATRARLDLPSFPEPARIRVDSARRTAKGRKFGRVLHRIMQNAILPIDREQLESLARSKEITPDDAKTAVELAIALFDHELLKTGLASPAVHRELPITVKLDDGRIVEGRADLVISDGESWTVIDFKTGSPEDRDERQVQLYAHALAIAKRQPVKAVILEI